MSVPYIIVNVYRINPTEVLSSILVPSQGLCNFIIFMSSKSRHVKRSNAELSSWFQAFVKVILSSGRTMQSRSFRKSKTLSHERTSRKNGSRSLSFLSRFRKKIPIPNQSSDATNMITERDEALETKLDEPDQNLEAGLAVLNGDGSKDDNVPVGGRAKFHT